MEIKFLLSLIQLVFRHVGRDGIGLADVLVLQVMYGPRLYVLELCNLVLCWWWVQDSYTTIFCFPSLFMVL